MTDRELLELAAKAAGYKIHLRVNEIHHHERFELIDTDKHWSQWPVWNPLVSDGDALRLAVKLGLIIDCTQEGDELRHQVPNVEQWAVYHDPGDPYGATRRTIVLVAAEIGRAAT